MAIGFRKVRPGQQYDGFPAPTYNAIIDVINAYRDGRLTLRTTPFDTILSSGIVPVKNATGTDLGRYAIVGIDTPVFTPTDDSNEFLAKVRFDGVTPTANHEPDRFAILLQPLKNGEVGRGLISGVSQVVISVGDELHEHAAVESGTTANLVSTSCPGGAQILWKETGTGSKKAIVRLHPAPPVAILEVSASSCVGEVRGAGCYWSGTIVCAGTSGADLCSPWTASNTVYIIATNACETGNKIQLRGGDRFIGVRVGRFDPGSDERDVYVVEAPHGKVQVNEDDQLDYLEDQFRDHQSSGTYGDGDLLVKTQTDTVVGDEVLRNYVDVADYDANYEQALTHAAGGDAPKWVKVSEITVVTDLRLYNNALEMQTATVKVLAYTDQGWSEAFPATEC